jgi:hypothetical protein
VTAAPTPRSGRSQPDLTRRRFLLGLGAVATAGGVAACAQRGDRDSQALNAPAAPRIGEDEAPRPRVAEAPAPGWRPSAQEILPRAKTLAVEAAELLGRSAPGQDAVAVLQAGGVSLTPALAGRAETVPLGGLQTAPPASSAARYAQMGGLVPLAVTATYASIMVLLEQQAPASSQRSVRTLDLRLRVHEGRWAVDDVASVGGDPVPRPEDLPDAARRVLDHPQIALADSARWDIHAGRIDPRLLQVMTALADRFAYAVTVLASGHPRYIIDGGAENRTSSHTRGLALDIWSVQGRPVREQSGDPQSPAARLLQAAAELPALVKIGAPLGWDLDGSRSRVFDDPVHEDHFHLALR